MDELLQNTKRLKLIPFENDIHITNTHSKTLDDLEYYKREYFKLLHENNNLSHTLHYYQNKQFEPQDCVYINLTGQDFSGLPWSQIEKKIGEHIINYRKKYEHVFFDFSCSNFSNTRLSNINLSKCKFVNTNFSGSDMYNVKFINTDMRNSNFTNVRMIQVNISDSNLQGADFTKLRMTKGFGISSNLKQTNFTDSGIEYTDFSYSDMQGAKLDKSVFWHSILVNTVLNRDSINSVYNNRFIETPLDKVIIKQEN